MKVKVKGDRLSYGREYHERDEVIDMPDDVCTGLLIKLGRVEKVEQEEKKVRKQSKKKTAYQRRDLTAEE